MGFRGRYPGNGPFRDLPPWQRPGRLYGRGYGYTEDPTACARFPWLPRWWWATPDSSVTPQTPPIGTIPHEKEFLENQLEFLKKQITDIQSRLDKLGKEKQSS